MKLKYLLIAIAFSVLTAFAGGKSEKIVILHTNDTHSQVEPIAGKNTGGYARRMGVINEIRKVEKHVLLLDAGDFSQGTPYFNFYNGRIEAHALRMMGYDAITFGNHEFDNGMDTLAVVLRDAKLPIVIANYDLSNTLLKDLVAPYKIFKKGGVKIGVFGMGVNLNGLTFKKNIEGLILKDHINTALAMSDFLRNKKQCDVVICLSHLGVTKPESEVTDYELAAASRNIDVIIGGHSHKLIENEKVKNADGKPVIIAQMGKSGVNLGRIDLKLEKP